MNILALAFVRLLLSAFILFGEMRLLADDSALNIPQYNSRLWQIEDGLPHNSVLAIAQTSDGYLWIT